MTFLVWRCCMLLPRTLLESAERYQIATKLRLQAVRSIELLATWNQCLLERVEDSCLCDLRSTVHLRNDCSRCAMWASGQVLQLRGMPSANGKCALHRGRVVGTVRNPWVRELRWSLWKSRDVSSRQIRFPDAGKVFDQERAGTVK